MFLKNKNIIFKIRRSKVTDYAALNVHYILVGDLSVAQYNQLLKQLHVLALSK